MAWTGVYSCKAQMAWNITRNEQSAETKRWQGAGETGERRFFFFFLKNSSVLQPSWLEKDQERGRNVFAMQSGQIVLREPAGAVRRSAGAEANQDHLNT